MTDDRLDADDRLAILEGQVRNLSGYLRQSAVRAAQAEQAQLQARLAPSLLPPSDTMRGDQSRTPDLGAPLMDRLRSDAAMAGSVAGSGLSAVSSGNVLDDPTFDTIPPTGSLTTSWQDMGPCWEGRYVLEPGSVVPTIDWTLEQGRVFYSSARLALLAQWLDPSDVGEVTVELRSKPLNPASDLYWSGSPIGWPWAVGSCRVWPSTVSTSSEGEFTTTVRLIDRDTDTELAASEPVELEAIETAELEVRPFVSLLDPPDSGEHLPALQIDLRMSSDGTGTFARTLGASLAEPQVHYTDEESPVTVLPLGRWAPYPIALGAMYVRDQDQSVSDSTFESLTFWGGKSSRYMDSHQMVSASTPTRFVAPFPGLWDAMMGAVFAASATNARQLRIIQYRAGGATSRVVASLRDDATATGEWKRLLSRPTLMEAGDWVEFQAWQNTGGALSLRGSPTSDETWAALIFRGYQNRYYNPGGGSWDLADW